ncbi:MAG: GNAT family N-acetyltransferase [Myxococcales bacterium]|nr:GNAT family N-acetyltransferase [Myxococcales bacterium]
MDGLRVARPTEVGAIVALVESAYRGEGSRVGWTTEADLLGGRRTGEDEVGPLVDAGAMHVWVRGGEVVGCVLLRPEAAGPAYLGMLTVRPTEQGRAVGDAILAAAERYARNVLGARAIRMTVISVRSELIAWYARRGYQRTGERAPFPYGDARFGEPKRDDLEFVVLQKSIG